MKKIICTIPEHALSGPQIVAMEAALQQTYQQQFGAGESATVLWCRLPPGQSYVAGTMGDVYIAMIETAPGLQQSRREDIMLAFTKVMADKANIPFEKPLVSVLDTAKVSEYLQANRQRLRWSSRLGFLLNTLVHALVSRKRDGFASIRANL